MRLVCNAAALDCGLRTLQNVPAQEDSLRPLLILTTAVLAVPLFAADQTLHDRQNICVVTVPSDWSLTPAIGTATSPDKKVSITVSSPSHGMTSVSDVAQTAPRMYKDDKVTKSSGSEFEMEGKSVLGEKPNFYRAVPAGGRVCIAEILYQNDKPAEAKAIVETLRAGK